MQRINNSELQKEFLNATRGNALNGVPQEADLKIIPVIEVNPKLLKEGIVVSSLRTTTATQTILTTPAGKDFYLSNVSIIIAKDATCDSATGSFDFQAYIDGTLTNVIRIPCITTTAQNINHNHTFTQPIKLSRGTAIQLTGTFTAGILLRSVTIQGYYNEIPNA